MWKQKCGNKGTYRKLIEAFTNAGYQEYADRVRGLCTDTDSGECKVILLYYITLFSTML